MTQALSKTRGKIVLERRGPSNQGQSSASALQSIRRALRGTPGSEYPSAVSELGRCPMRKNTLIEGRGKFLW